MNRFVYADNAATTPMSESVFEAMKPYLTEHYGNPVLALPHWPRGTPCGHRSAHEGLRVH